MWVASMGNKSGNVPPGQPENYFSLLLSLQCVARLVFPLPITGTLPTYRGQSLKLMFEGCFLFQDLHPKQQELPLHLCQHRPGNLFLTRLPLIMKTSLISLANRQSHLPKRLLKTLLPLRMKIYQMSRILLKPKSMNPLKLSNTPQSQPVLLIQMIWMIHISLSILMNQKTVKNAYDMITQSNNTVDLAYSDKSDSSFKCDHSNESEYSTNASYMIAQSNNIDVEAPAASEVPTAPRDQEMSDSPVVHVEPFEPDQFDISDAMETETPRQATPLPPNPAPTPPAAALVNILHTLSQQQQQYFQYAQAQDDLNQIWPQFPDLHVVSEAAPTVPNQAPVDDTTSSPVQARRK